MLILWGILTLEIIGFGITKPYSRLNLELYITEVGKNLVSTNKFSLFLFNLIFIIIITLEDILLLSLIFHFYYNTICYKVIIILSCTALSILAVYLKYYIFDTLGNNHNNKIRLVLYTVMSVFFINTINSQLLILISIPIWLFGTKVMYRYLAKNFNNE